MKISIPLATGSLLVISILLPEATGAQEPHSTRDQQLDNMDRVARPVLSNIAVSLLNNIP